jgi:hypothetical protein
MCYNASLIDSKLYCYTPFIDFTLCYNTTYIDSTLCYNTTLCESKLTQHLMTLLWPQPLFPYNIFHYKREK